MKRIGIALVTILACSLGNAHASAVCREAGAQNDPLGQFSMCADPRASGYTIAPSASVLHCSGRNSCDSLVQVTIPATGAQLNSSPSILQQSGTLQRIPNVCSHTWCSPNSLNYPGLYADTPQDFVSLYVIGIPLSSVASIPGFCVGTLGNCSKTGVGVGGYVQVKR